MTEWPTVLKAVPEMLQARHGLSGTRAAYRRSGMRAGRQLGTKPVPQEIGCTFVVRRLFFVRGRHDLEPCHPRFDLSWAALQIRVRKALPKYFNDPLRRKPAAVTVANDTRNTHFRRMPGGLWRCCALSSPCLD